MTTFYKKIGRKYVPVSEYDHELSYALPAGVHCIKVSPGQTFKKFNVNEMLAPLVAASLLCKDEMVNKVYEASGLKPKVQPLSKEQAEAWENLKKAFKDDFFTLSQSSALDVVEAGIEQLIVEANKLLQNEATKKAYEQFLLVSKLTSSG